jgi:hypothetical protein
MTRLKRQPLYYWLKLCRGSGYVLFFLMLLFVGTGFALCGKCGVDQLIRPATALFIHKLFDLPLVVLFLLHSLLAIYFALRRWKWIR